MIVVDANVIAYLHIEGEKTAQAVALYGYDADWIAPSLWEHEFLNVLANYVKQEGFSKHRAILIWNEAFQLMSPRTRPVDMSLTLALAVDHGISAYDAQYIELARSLGVICVTEDKRLRNLFPRMAMSMRDYVLRSR